MRAADGRRRVPEEAPLPVEVTEVWNALRLPALIAGERMTDAGRR